MLEDQGKKNGNLFRKAEMQIMQIILNLLLAQVTNTEKKKKISFEDFKLCVLVEQRGVAGSERNI